MKKFFAIAAVVAGLMTIGSAGAHAEAVCSLGRMGRAEWTKCLYRQRWEHQNPEEAKKRAQKPVLCSLARMGREAWTKCIYRQRYSHQS